MKNILCNILAAIIFVIDFLIVFSHFARKYGFIETCREADLKVSFEHFHSLRKRFMTTFFEEKNNA